ncbi:NAD-dependent epimerase/dehydratase [Laribacter hongkongensis]|uniref:NAD-dependent epimerase/dehydratase n=1 Tax=Laribacter hongkongensis TaxID=168471 RepID=UPI001EFEA0D4|nr:NAD-dependent epimerase/dehydratase [Laribacter hongkongensis]MCG8995481.1 NAD-dependent epimerase/dehydratase [Laribacter hongkongensis]MCG9010298.1 NAD-dependent epimerase/dehydratase [Laribacter hongkongensis]MCG9046192.1 NAD-dependent epimerase/dehydratase [Laribacter hongkongensis]MCG9073764.1 NAD-dependent epimerase/dehydratase [Laribacter hongkongensis]
MRVLVAGGFGFVGGRVAQALASAGHTVVLGTRQTRPHSDWLQAGIVQCLDWENPSQLCQACHGVAAIVHAAGMNAADCAADAAAALHVNGVYSARLVQAAIDAGVARFFYFSTAHVYASPLAGNIDEQTCPRNMHPYATSHLAGEHALLHALQRGALHGSVLRLSNGFGRPAQAAADCWGLLANELCRQAVVQRKLVLRSGGAQLRDFIPLSAVCADVQSLLRCPADQLPPILNMVSAEAISVAGMASLIQQRCALTLGYTPPLEYGQGIEPSPSLRMNSLHAQHLQLARPVDLASELDELLAFCCTQYEGRLQ